MVELATAFLLGPLYFFPQLLSVGSASPTNFAVFLASGLGTAFWTAVLTVIGGLVQGL